MMFLAVRIEYAFDATSQRSHNPMRANIVGPSWSATILPPSEPAEHVIAGDLPPRAPDRDAFKEHLHAIGNWPTIPS